MSDFDDAARKRLLEAAGSRDTELCADIRAAVSEIDRLKAEVVDRAHDHANDVAGYHKLVVDTFSREQDNYWRAEKAEAELAAERAVSKAVALRDGAEIERRSSEVEQLYRANRKLEAKVAAERERVARVEKAREWMLHRCDYGPPCGRCRWCEAAKKIAEALRPAAPVTCPHGAESRAACDVCSGRGIWEMPQDVGNREQL